MKGIIPKPTDMVVDFGGLYCRDCLYYEPVPGGGGTCKAKSSRHVWPGDKICSRFTQ